MPLKLRLKAGDRLVINSAYLEVERVGQTNVSVSIEAPEEVAIFIRRKTTSQSRPNTVEND